MSPWRSGDEVAIDVGRLCAVVQCLHRLLGAASLTCPTPKVTVVLDEWSLQMAEHSTSLYDHLPLRAGFDRASVVHLGTYDPTLSMLGSWGQSGQEAAFMAGFVDGVVPALRRDSAALHQRTSDVAERGLRRSLSFFEIDLEELSLRGSELLLALTTDPELRAQADDARAALPDVVLA